MATSPLRNSMVQEHEYHADASLLSGHLKLPVDQDVRPGAAVRLRDWKEGHYFQRADHYSLEGLISFESGYTHVSGARSLKAGHGWVTLSTSVLEGLNVLDVITADRMVAQVSTEHPQENGFVPHVTFLGTQFENLKVGGYDLNPKFKLDICGPKPAGDTQYTKDATFLKRVTDQRKIITKAGLPTPFKSEYDGQVTRVTKGKQGVETKLKCSLVTGVDPVPVATSYGNVLQIPGFGLVYLGEVELTENVDQNGYPSSYFHLTMLRMEMGCIGDGSVSAGGAGTNGHHHP